MSVSRNLSLSNQIQREYWLRKFKLIQKSHLYPREKQAFYAHLIKLLAVEDDKHFETFKSHVASALKSEKIVVNAHQEFQLSNRWVNPSTSITADDIHEHELYSILFEGNRLNNSFSDLNDILVEVDKSSDDLEEAKVESIEEKDKETQRYESPQEYNQRLEKTKEKILKLVELEENLSIALINTNSIDSKVGNEVLERMRYEIVYLFFSLTNIARCITDEANLLTFEVTFKKIFDKDFTQKKNKDKKEDNVPSWEGESTGDKIPSMALGVALIKQLLFYRSIYYYRLVQTDQLCKLKEETFLPEDFFAKYEIDTIVNGINKKKGDYIYGETHEKILDKLNEFLSTKDAKKETAKGDRINSNKVGFLNLNIHNLSEIILPGRGISSETLGMPIYGKFQSVSNQKQSDNENKSDNSNLSQASVSTPTMVQESSSTATIPQPKPSSSQTPKLELKSSESVPANSNQPASGRWKKVAIAFTIGAICTAAVLTGVGMAAIGAGILLAGIVFTADLIIGGSIVGGAVAAAVTAKVYKKQSTTTMLTKLSIDPASVGYNPNIENEQSQADISRRSSSTQAYSPPILSSGTDKNGKPELEYKGRIPKK